MDFEGPANVEKAKSILRKCSFATRVWRAYRGAVNVTREGNLGERVLSRLGILQLYAGIRRSKVPADLYGKGYYLNRDGCEGSQEFAKYKGAKLSNRLATVLSEIQETQDIDGHTFLDLGCGRGELSLQLEKKAKRVVSVDYSIPAIKTAKQILKKAELVQADIVDFLPRLRTEEFDGILMIDIVEHLFDWELKIVFNNIRRLLKRGGYLYIDMPIIKGRPYSKMHVNIKASASQYLSFLSGFIVTKEVITDPRGSNHLIVLQKNE